MNDGKTESWAFTEIDRSLATGVVQDGGLWHRDRDELGAVLVLNGLSPEHRAYSQGGGMGFILGDGALRDGPEMLFDTYYKLSLADNVSFSGVYQPIINPGYNRDRDPVHVLTGRLRRILTLPALERKRSSCQLGVTALRIFRFASREPAPAKQTRRKLSGAASAGLCAAFCAGSARFQRWAEWFRACTPRVPGRAYCEHTARQLTAHLARRRGGFVCR